MLLFSIIKLWFILLCGQGGAVEDAKEKHAILATNDKLYLAQLSESKRENNWRPHDYQGEKPDELKNKIKTTEQDDKSKGIEDGKNKEKKKADKKKADKKKADKKKADKKKADKKKPNQKKADKKKTPFEIVGGYEALPHEFPWIAQLHMQCHQLLYSNCGGSLISPRVVLSAYHCSCNWERQGQYVDYRALNSFAKLGAHNLNHKTYTTNKIIDVKFPPNTAPYTASRTIPENYHDIAMFVLNEPVKFSTKISPICLPTQGQDFYGKTAIAAGWGTTETVRNSPALKKIQLVVAKSKFNKIPTKSLIGIGHDTCRGDSGGPLMYKTTTSYTLIGTLSSGQDPCGRDGGGGLFNKVSDWVDWIKKEMDQLGEKADGKICNIKGGKGFGNQDNGGDDVLDNQDKNGGDGLGNQDQDAGDDLGNQDQLEHIWPFGPFQDPLFQL